MERKITADENGIPIKKMLLDRLGFSRGALTSLKHKEDGITVNGEHKTVRYILQEGDVLKLKLEDTAPSKRIRESEGEIDILYEDEHLLAVNKPANMAVHPSKKLQDDTLAGRILHHRYPMVFRAAGRLDKDTSGVVISAKTRVVSAKLFALIKKHGIHKEYLVLCESEKEPPREGEISLAIRRDEISYIKRVCYEEGESTPDSEKSLTRFRLIASQKPYHLFLASPITGRTHQLRAHFSAIGFPLAGDTLYGKESDLIGRQALHCRSLTFPHPETGEEVKIVAPLHEDYTAALRAAFPEAIDLREAVEKEKI